MERVRMRLLHAAAMISVRTMSPRRAHAVIGRLGRLLQPFSSVREAHEALAVLGERGTCLSRAVALSSRMRGAMLVIGVDPRRSGPMASHAWVEWRGAVLSPPADGIEEIARLS
jgi:hypothetical protein